MLIASFFFLGTRLHHNLFYVFLLSGLFYTKFPDKKDLLFMLVSLYLGLYWVSVLWSFNEDYEEYWRSLKVAPLIFLSLFICSSFKIRPYIGVYSYSAAVSAFILLVVNFQNIFSHYILPTSDIWRLEAFGRGENENIAAILYGAAALILICKKEIPYRYWCLLFILPVFFLTLSRGALLAFVVSVTIVSVLSEKKLLFSFIPIFFFPLLFPEIATYMIERGMTGRSEIWLQAYNYFLSSPIIGYGAANNLTYEVVEQNRTYNHTHNIYLATLNDTGLIGLVLLLSILVVIVRRSYLEENYALLSVILFGCVLGMFDLGGFYTSLGAEWVIFWFPIFILLSKEKNKTE